MWLDLNVSVGMATGWTDGDMMMEDSPEGAADDMVLSLLTRSAVDTGRDIVYVEGWGRGVG